MNNLNLKQHDDILFIVFEQCYNKVEQKDKLDAKAKMIATLKQYIKKQRDQFVSGVLKSAQKKIESHVDAHVDAHVADEEMKQKKEYRVLVSQNNISKSSIQEKLQYYQSYITQNSNLTSTELDKIICQFITKPAYLVPLLSHYL